MFGHFDELNRLISGYELRKRIIFVIGSSGCFGVHIDGRMDFYWYILHSLRDMSELIALVHLSRWFQNGSHGKVTIVFLFCA
jgi:hypothetical protein